MASSTEEFMDYVQTLMPKSSIRSQTDAGMMLMHLITLLRVYDGRVDLERTRSSSGESFVAKIMSHARLVHELASGLKLQPDLCWVTDRVPKWLEQRAKDCGVNTASVRTRHSKMEETCYETSMLVLFVRVAREVMKNVHKDTLRGIDRAYNRHWDPSYMRKKWLGIKSKGDVSKMRLRASDLPGAKAVRAPIDKPTIPRAPSVPPVTRPAATVKYCAPAPTSFSTHAPQSIRPIALRAPNSISHQIGASFIAAHPHPYSPYSRPAHAFPYSSAHRVRPTHAQLQYAQYSACLAYQQAMYHAAGTAQGGKTAG